MERVFIVIMHLKLHQCRTIVSAEFNATSEGTVSELRLATTDRCAYIDFVQCDWMLRVAFVFSLVEFSSIFRFSHACFLKIILFVVTDH
jgi:hypothetical protein